MPVPSAQPTHSRLHVTVREGERVYVGEHVQISAEIDRARDRATLYIDGPAGLPLSSLGVEFLAKTTSPTSHVVTFPLAEKLGLPTLGAEVGVKYADGGCRMVELGFFAPRVLRIERQCVRRKRLGAA